MAGEFTALNKLFPRWGKRINVKKLLDAMAAPRDEVVDRLDGGLQARMVEKAPVDALVQIGATCALARASADTDDSFRQYLRDPFARWYAAGTEAGMLAELAHLGLSNCQVWSYRRLVDAGADPATTFGGIASFFFVYVGKPNPFGAAAATYNDNSTRWLGGGLWGMDGAIDRLDEIRRVVSEWKPAHTSCRFLLIDLDGTGAVQSALWGVPDWGAFNWGLAIVGNTQAIPIHEPWEYGESGSAPEFYNYSYSVERTT